MLAAVVVDVEADPVVGVLLDQDALGLVPVAGGGVELDAQVEVGVVDVLHDAQRAVGAPGVVAGAGGDGEVGGGVGGALAGGGDGAVAEGVDDGPAVRVDAAGEIVRHEGAGLLRRARSDQGQEQRQRGKDHQQSVQVACTTSHRCATRPSLTRSTYSRPTN